ncbi:IclR family transcriptional regulator [Natranaerobius thermophilus]|uniref:Glycerol operon regulatory protein n=1 Tax=Natranaerobius thermophilus (strain ATCC BAA-1301 / DSM 18059 / JW/NM-WN-LF) TaxID=457570 RepID=B2A2F0_NATTJ|nr:IclR family transcriptional regulator [Natranaerobius thermophilus]ACB86256.1 transcriptional regulator, IclR family [Natranaerobius thermophilus JW/NM-WN-LF]
MSDSESKNIQAIERALDVLLLFLEKKRELGVSEISHSLGYYKSTVHRILSTLSSRGFIYKNPITNKYWLGVKNFSLGMLYQDKFVLKDVAYPYLKKLSEDVNETVNLAILDEIDDPEVIVVEKIQTEHMLTISPPVGSRTPAHCSGVGKVLLAYSDEGVLEQLKQKPLEEFTSNTIADFKELYRILEEVREKGYAIDYEEIEIGLSCLATPIFDQEGHAVAAVSVSGPVNRIYNRFPEIIKQLKLTSAQISKFL